MVHGRSAHSSRRCPCRQRPDTYRPASLACTESRVDRLHVRGEIGWLGIWAEGGWQTHQHSRQVLTSCPCPLHRPVVHSAPSSQQRLQRRAARPCEQRPVRRWRPSRHTPTPTPTSASSTSREGGSSVHTRHWRVESWAAPKPVEAIQHPQSCEQGTAATAWVAPNTVTVTVLVPGSGGCWRGSLCRHPAGSSRRR